MKTIRVDQSIKFASSGDQPSCFARWTSRSIKPKRMNQTNAFPKTSEGLHFKKPSSINFIKTSRDLSFTGCRSSVNSFDAELLEKNKSLPKSRIISVKKMVPVKGQSDGYADQGSTFEEILLYSDVPYELVNSSVHSGDVFAGNAYQDFNKQLFNFTDIEKQSKSPRNLGSCQRKINSSQTRTSELSGHGNEYSSRKIHLEINDEVNIYAPKNLKTTCYPQSNTMIQTEKTAKSDLNEFLKSEIRLSNDANVKCSKRNECAKTTPGYKNLLSSASTEVKLPSNKSLYEYSPLQKDMIISPYRFSRPLQKSPIQYRDRKDTPKAFLYPKDFLDSKVLNSQSKTRDSKSSNLRELLNAKKAKITAAEISNPKVSPVNLESPLRPELLLSSVNVSFVKSTDQSLPLPQRMPNWVQNQSPKSIKLRPIIAKPNARQLKNSQVNFNGFIHESDSYRPIHYRDIQHFSLFKKPFVESAEQGIRDIKEHLLEVSSVGTQIMEEPRARLDHAMARFLLSLEVERLLNIIFCMFSAQEESTSDKPSNF